MLHASDLLTPKGRLNAAALWPGVDVNVASSTIEEYLGEGYTKASAITDSATLAEAARQWAYYRAWIQKYDDLCSLPADVSSSEEGSAAYSAEQIQSWKDRADSALTVFESLVEEAEGVETGYAVIRSLR